MRRVVSIAATATLTSPAAPEPTSVATPTAPAALEPTSVAVSGRPVATPVAIRVAPEDTPPAEPTAIVELTAAPTRISEVLPDAQPEPTAVRGGTSLPQPSNVNVNWTGCASDGECHWFNFYWAPTHELVMQPGEPPHKVWHERCHAHQHWSINGGDPLAPSDYDLESWYSTTEGVGYAQAVAGLNWPWTDSAQNTLEDFAWTCGYWYGDPAYLLSVSPGRYAWALDNLP